jgi:acyl carrier protein
MSSALSLEQIREQTFAVVAKHAKKEASMLTPELTLADLGIASLSAIEIIFDLEELFDVDFPEQSPAFDTGTLQELIDAISRALAAKATKA